MGTFSYPERSHTVHLRVLKPSLWNSPWRCNHLHDSSSLFRANTSLTTGESTTNYSWWRSLENPRLHKKPSSIANKVYFTIPFLNTWWPLVSDGSLLTGEKCKQVKQQKLLFATTMKIENSQPQVLFYFILFICFHYLRGLLKKRGRGSDCVLDVVSLCLSDDSSAWICFSAELLPSRHGQGSSSKRTSQHRRQSSHLHQKIFINPFKNLQIALLFTADVQIFILQINNKNMDQNIPFVLIKPYLIAWLIL